MGVSETEVYHIHGKCKFKMENNVEPMDFRVSYLQTKPHHNPYQQIVLSVPYYDPYCYPNYL